MRRNIILAVTLTSIATLVAQAQDYSPLNFNVGGGVGFPLSTTSDFANDGASFAVGAGPNVSRLLGFSGEFMWNDLPIKRSVINAVGVPNASAREYALTGNAIVRIPIHSPFGVYAIGGGGWYHRSGEATAPGLVPGTVCPGFWDWWGVCVNGLWPANVVIHSSSSDSFGGNIGGGLTFGRPDGLKFYAEVRYHHAAHDKVNTDILPLTFGVRW